jgi:enamine deaminase RidA (YjgF/YER057c/UK114 family)
MVKSRGGTTLYLAGMGGARDASGNVRDFEGQVRATFESMGATLALAGAGLDDVVTMTVFVNDIRNGVRFTEIRREYFKAGYPASALIGVSAFMDPAMMVEIQAIAVIP